MRSLNMREAAEETAKTYESVKDQYGLEPPRQRKEPD